MTLAERHLEMLRRMASLDPPPRFMGGYAEDAFVAGAVTRPHGDLDWIFPRRGLDVRCAQAEQLGFSGFRTHGEAAPGVPFYLEAEAGELRMPNGQRESSRLLREKFFPGRSSADLEPLIEPLR